MGEGWTVQSLLRELAPRGEQPAVMTVRGETVESWSCADVADRAQRLASGLVQAGVEPGEPVGLLAPNSPEWVVVRLAIGAAGAIAVALDDLFTDAEVATVIRDSGCRRVFTTRDHLPALRRASDASGLELFLIDRADAQDGGEQSWLGLLAQPPGQLPTLAAEAPTMLTYSSGTTGAPKGFTLSHVNLSANLQALLAEGLLGPADRVLLPLPLHHVYPLVVGVLTALSSGATIIFPEAVTGPNIVRALRAARVTTMIGVPALYAALLSGLEGRVAARGRAAKAAFAALLGLAVWLLRRFGLRVGRGLFRGLHGYIGPDLRLMVSGGARLEPEVIWKLEGLGWQVLSGYGLAETASIFTGNRPGRRRIGSEGLPLVGAAPRIADADENGVGEIQLRGPNVFTGYRNDAAANHAAFTDDGWLRTGDLGYLDADGYLYVTGRAKEMIVLGGGKNVLPEELEKTYGDSPFMHEVAVLERSGKLVALARPNFEAIKASGYTGVDDVLRVTLTSLSRRLPSFQRVSGFAIAREPLPRTRLGKFMRYRLPQVYERARKGAAPPAPAAPSQEDRALLGRPPARKVWDYLRARYPRATLTLETIPQLDLGVDSLEWVTITLELEDRFGIKLTEDEISRVITVRDLLQAATAAGRRAAAPPAERPPQGLAPDQERWLRPPGAALAALGMVLYALNWTLMRLVFRLRVAGAESLPQRGPYVLVANHASDLDPLALAAALPLSRMREVYWGGDVARLFSRAVTRLPCRALHIFPVDERSPASSLALASEVLARDNALAWFPEMWRSPTGELQRFLPGVGMLLARSGAPVVPVFISGTFEAMPRWRRLPRPHRISVTLGPPLDATELEGAGEGGTAYDRIASALRDRVAGLSRSAGGSGRAE